MSLYKIVRFFGIPIAKLLYPIEYVHKENLIKNGKNIVVCNHMGKADVLMIASLFKDKSYFLSKQEYYKNKFIAKILTSIGGIPIDRDKPSFQTMRQAVKVLNDDKRLVIFPEGTRNKVDNKLQEIKQGTAFFAIKGKSQITPIMIYKRFKVFRKNYVIIGKPIDFSKYYDVKFTEDVSIECTNIIRDTLLSLQQELFTYVDEKKKKKGKNK
jgi:1-acyl-sn-glycerol-3-phosphate acyltransferase